MLLEFIFIFFYMILIITKVQKVEEIYTFQFISGYFNYRINLQNTFKPFMEYSVLLITIDWSLLWKL